MAVVRQFGTQPLFSRGRPDRPHGVALRPPGAGRCRPAPVLRRDQPRHGAVRRQGLRRDPGRASGGVGHGQRQVVWDHTVADYKASYSFTLMPLALDARSSSVRRGQSSASAASSRRATPRPARKCGRRIPFPHRASRAATPGRRHWKYGGGSAWVTGAYDPELNNIYWGVGQPAVGPPCPPGRQSVHQLHHRHGSGFRGHQVPLPIHPDRSERLDG